MLNIGKLYQVKRLYWYLYPSKDIAPAPAAAMRHATVAAARWAEYFSKQFNCNVTYISPNDIFCLLLKEEKFLKVLSTNGEIGWMYHPTDKEWTKGYIEEVNE